MTFRALSPNTIPALNLGQSRKRALMLYKEWLREIPRSIMKYPLDFTVAEGRSRLRVEFERYKNLSNLEQINRIILKGTMELIETHNKWKQKMHIMRMYEDMNNEWYREVQLKRELPRDILQNATPFLKEFLNKGSP